MILSRPSFRLATLAAAAAGLLMAATTAEAQPSSQAQVAVDLNMRTGPSTGYPVVRVLPAGATVGVFGCNSAQTWCQLSYAGSSGWAAARYLRFQSAGPQPQPQPQPPAAPQGQVQARTTVSLNMRTGPSTGYSVIRAIPAGATVNVNRCTNSYSWCEVYYAGSTGWASARYLQSVTPQYQGQPMSNIGAQLGLRLIQFVLGQIAGGGGQQPPPDQDQRPGLGANQICFYRDYNYAGPYFCARMGQSDASLGAQENDQISSIRVGSNARVEVCEDFNYSGNCRIVTGDIAQLPNSLNDRISSYRTTQIGGGGGGGGNPTGRACFYADYNYNGAAFCLDRGQSIAQLGPQWNDRISSFRVEGGATVTACEDFNYGGRCLQFGSNAVQLSGDANDSISSIRVQ